ncbi:MAG TPA: efflux RND transporter permease subunit, partial [Myxococcota bacterium]|nr:efflux RND transporter permease subunit [Myxococcota bacterium]
VLSTVLAFLILLLGFQGLFNLQVRQYPEVEETVITITTIYPGASADDVNENLSRTLEEEFAALEGVVKIRATSQDNLSLLSIEFHYDRDVDMAAVDVQNAIARIRGALPAGIGEPQVLKFSTSDRPVISVGVAADDPTRARKMAEDRFAPELQRVPGVAAVDVFGGARPAVLVEIDRRNAEAYRLPLGRIVEAIREHDSALPAGEIRTETEQTMFRLESRARDIEALSRIPILLPDGTHILLGEVATVRQGALDDDARFAVDGQAAIAMQVFKTEEANTVDVVRAVQARIGDLGQQYPDYRFLVGEESATFTEISVDNLLSNVWQALLFASVIIFLFLGRLKTSAVTIVSMPLSYGLTFAFMHAFGVEFNMVTLSAVILAVGMVVDAAVVILENITRRRDEDGLSPEDAAAEGTDEVRLAVLAGVATTLVVLVPLLFLEGFIGKTFGPLALTLIFAFTSSVLVALVLVPVLTLYTAGTGRLDRVAAGVTGYVTRPFAWAMDRVRDGYVGALRLALRHRLVVIVAVLALFAGSLVGLRGLGMDVLPKMDGGSFFITLETPSGSSLQETARVVGEVERLLADEPEVVKVQSQAGFEQGMRS